MWHGKHDGIKTLTIYAGVEPKSGLRMRDVSNWVDDSQLDQWCVTYLPNRTLLNCEYQAHFP